MGSLTGLVELESGDSSRVLTPSPGSEPCAFSGASSAGPPLPHESAKGCPEDPGWGEAGQHSPGQVHHGLQDVVTQRSAALSKGDTQLLQPDRWGCRCRGGDPQESRRQPPPPRTRSSDKSPIQYIPKPTLMGEAACLCLPISMVPSLAPLPTVSPFGLAKVSKSPPRNTPQPSE